MSRHLCLQVSPLVDAMSFALSQQERAMSFQVFDQLGSLHRSVGDPCLLKYRPTAIGTATTTRSSGAGLISLKSMDSPPFFFRRIANSQPLLHQQNPSPSSSRVAGSTPCREANRTVSGDGKGHNLIEPRPIADCGLRIAQSGSQLCGSKVGKREAH
jgi:hypothetical protein